MSVYSEKLYSTFLYGPDPAVISTVSPDTGPSIGGQSIIIEGTGFDPRQWDDLFEGAILDAALWTDISGGTGAVATGVSTHLELSTGVGAGAVAGIESIATWNDCQHEIKVNLPIVNNPAGDVVPIALQLYIDANNYALFYVGLDTAGAYTLNCDVYRAGASVGTYSQTISRGVSTLRILRWGTTVYFIYNGTIVYYNADFVNTTAYARVYATNVAETYDVTSTVEWFYWRSYITIDDQLIYAPTVVSNFRIRGLTPPSVDDKDTSAAYAGLANVGIVANGKDVNVDAYEYYFTDRLRVMNIDQFSILLSVIDDDQLITRSTVQKGL